MKKTFTLKTNVWLYPGPPAGGGRWHFVTIPTKETKDINYFFHHAKRGWGSLPVQATIGNTTWKSSIFPDKKTNSYLLPLKAQIRKKEGVKAGDTITLSLEIHD